MKRIGETIHRPDMMVPRRPDGVVETPPVAQSARVVKEVIGLGDWIYRVAHPVGCWIDRRTAILPKHWRTGLCGCSACSARRRRLNEWMPDVKGWKGGWQVACRRLARALPRAFLRLIDRCF